MTRLLPFLLATLAWGADAPFSHRLHAPLKMRCAQCHTGGEREEAAGFPAVAQCQVCHTTMAERTIPSRRIYEVRDFVVFSHARHAASKVACATCHGEVYTQETMKVERQTTMAACVACHKEHKATTACNACHELGQ